MPRGGQSPRPGEADPRALEAMALAARRARETAAQQEGTSSSTESTLGSSAERSNPEAATPIAQVEQVEQVEPVVPRPRPVPGSPEPTAIHLAPAPPEPTAVHEPLPPGAATIDDVDVGPRRLVASSSTSGHVRPSRRASVGSERVYVPAPPAVHDPPPEFAGGPPRERGRRRRGAPTAAAVLVGAVLVSAAAVAAALVVEGQKHTPGAGHTAASTPTTSIPPTKKKSPKPTGSTTTTSPAAAAASGPRLSSINPSSGTAGQTVVISGTDLYSSNGEVVAYFGTTSAPTSCSSTTSCSATVPDLGSGSASTTVTIRTASGTSNGLAFSYH